MGHVICQDGLKPDPDKVQGITEMPTPSSKQDVKWLLCMVNYLQKFSSNLCEITAPMRDLLKDGNQFQWDEQLQGRSFGGSRRYSRPLPSSSSSTPKKK